MFRFAKFREDHKGNVGMMFSIMLLPMLMFVGVAVDYSRIANQESELQTIVDNAARTVPNLRNKRLAAAEQIEQLINANSGRNTAEVEISIYRNKLRIDAKDYIDTPLLSTIGQEKSEITASIEMNANRNSGQTNSGGSQSISKKQFEDAIDAQFDEALKQMGMGGNLNRLSPTQRTRLKKQLEKRLRQMGMRFK